MEFNIGLPGAHTNIYVTTNTNAQGKAACDVACDMPGTGWVQVKAGVEASEQVWFRFTDAGA